MAEESYLSGPNVTWFLVGIFAEVAFLGIGVSPMGMEWGSEIAVSLGLVEPFNATASVGIDMAAETNISESTLASTGEETFTFNAQ